ncbi:MAG: glycosyltransferase family 2 protein [Elusimicrobia bacterium]|nr:glycosyltransferase family 2 protein [Elusimicrobiota bacterium]
MAEPFLSVVVPVYNEERRLSAGLEEILAYLGQFPESWELVLVDDGSRDATAHMALQWSRREPRIRLERLPRNQGKGAAVRAGMLAARGRFRLFRDIDSSTEMGELDGFLPHLRAGAPIVIGSRNARDSRIVRRQMRLREWFGKGFVLLCRLLLVWEVRDFTCGFKCFSAQAAEAIFPLQRVHRWAFDAEILFLAKKLDFPILQSPVTWKDEAGSKVRILRDVVCSLWEIFRIKLNDWTGAYRP